jgi:hypothetical protein
MNKNEEALHSLLQPFAGEWNDSHTRQNMTDIIREYVLDTIKVEDVTTPTLIDSNSTMHVVSVLGKKYVILLKPTDNQMFRASVSISDV